MVDGTPGDVIRLPHTRPILAGSNPLYRGRIHPRGNLEAPTPDAGMTPARPPRAPGILNRAGQTSLSCPCQYLSHRSREYNLPVG